MNLYTFTETRFARTNTPWKQYFHIVSEVIELGMALFRKDKRAIGRESWDVRCSTETFQRIVAAAGTADGVDIAEAREEVIAGHRERKYY
jgi:hypothetical protein